MKKLFIFLLLASVFGCKKNDSTTKHTTHSVYYRIVGHDLNGDTTVSKIIVVQE